MKRTLWIAGSILAAAAAAIGLVFWQSFTGPMYEPGMVRDQKNLRAPLIPAQQSDGGEYLQVEHDIRLYHYAHGQGKPILVVHGGPGYPIQKPFEGLRPLESNYQFVYYDQRGCGKSSRPFDRFESTNWYANMVELESTLGIGAQIADIERIRHLLKQEKLILIGHSFGAFLSAMYAAEFPHHVEALILVAPSDVLVLPGEGKGFFDLVRERLPDDQKSEYDQFLEAYLGFDSIFTKSENELATMNRRLGDYFLVAAGESGSNSHEANNGGWMVQAMYFSMGREHDYRAALRAVHAPVLIIHGEDDLMPRSVSEIYRASFVNAKLETISGKTRGLPRAGHFVFSDRPDEFASIVSKFLGESVAASTSEP